jgi:hypothetical protein
MRKFLLLLVVTILAFTGCGGDDADSTDTGGDAASGTSEEGSGGGDDTDFSGSGSGDFCDLARDYAEEFEETAEATDETELAESYKEFAGAVDELAKEAPGEIEADVELVNRSFQQFVDLLEKYDYDLSKIPEDEAAEIDFDSEEIEDANRRIESYFEKVCEIDTDEDGDTDGVIDDGSADDATTEDEQAPDESVDE